MAPQPLVLPDDDATLLTTEEVSRVLRCARGTVLALVARGDLPVVILYGTGQKKGTLRRYRAGDVRALIDSSTERSAAPEPATIPPTSEPARRERPARGTLVRLLGS